MGRGITLVTEPPNLENTIPVSLYRQSSPERFSCPDDDKFVLHACALNLDLNLLAGTQVSLDIDADTIRRVTVFVLNTNILLWSEAGEMGLSIPYQCISIHGLQDGNLYMQLSENAFFLKSNDEPAEISFAANITLENHASQTASLSSSNSSISEVYEAIAQCSAMHLDSEDEQDEENGGEHGEGEYDAEVPAQWLDGNIHETVVSMDGNADDLDGNDPGEISGIDGEAGMDVDVGFASIAGSVRKLGEDSDAPCPKRAK